MDNTAVEFINAGKQVKLPRGEMIVKALCLEDLQILADDIINFILTIQSKTQDKTDTINLAKLVIASKETLESIKKLFAACTEKKPEDFNKLSLKETGILIKAFLEVNDIEELRLLFFDILKMLNGDTEPEPKKDSN